MASSWADKLPVVTVPNGDTPKRVTLIYPYYESPVFLRKQFAHWCAQTFDPTLSMKYWSVIVVDDGSPDYTAHGALRQCELAPLVRLFRIEQDVPWNWLAARNVGAHYAEDGWLLLTDMDHVVNRDTLKSLIYGQHDPNVVYALSRIEHTGKPITPHSASLFMTRAMFWKIGGYDERLSGVYGTDGLYRRRVAAVAPVQVLTDVLVRYEFVGDSSVTTLERKTPAMREARNKRLASLPAGQPLVMSFPHHEVSA